MSQGTVITCEYVYCRYNERRLCTAPAIVLSDGGYDGMECAAYHYSDSKRKEQEVKDAACQ